MFISEKQYIETAFVANWLVCSLKIWWFVDSIHGRVKPDYEIDICRFSVGNSNE